MSESFIPYGRQTISQADIDSVVDVLKSDWLTQGPVVQQFEKKLSNYCQAKHALAVCNGTAALHLACLALGVGPGDCVWTSPNTFAASANCVLYCGATVDFVDIDLETYNMDINKLESKLKQAEREGELPKVVIPVHFAGQSCDMKRIKALSDQYGFKIIEDACHAIGGKYLDEPVGNCKYSDIAVFSFHPVKIMTTGEGGALLTNDDDLDRQIRLLSSHGITRDSSIMMSDSHGGWYYEQLALGFNYRITDIQSALGCRQLEDIDEFVSQRNKLAEEYDNLLQGMPVITPAKRPFSYSAFHLYVIRLELDKIKFTRKQVFGHLREKNIGAQIHYIPVNTQPYFREQGFSEADCPKAQEYYESCITLPLYPTLTADEQLRVVEGLKAAIQ